MQGFTEAIEEGVGFMHQLAIRVLRISIEESNYLDLYESCKYSEHVNATISPKGVVTISMTENVKDALKGEDDAELITDVIIVGHGGNNIRQETVDYLVEFIDVFDVTASLNAYNNVQVDEMTDNEAYKFVDDFRGDMCCSFEGGEIHPPSQKQASTEPDTDDDEQSSGLTVEDLTDTVGAERDLHEHVADQEPN